MGHRPYGSDYVRGSLRVASVLEVGPGDDEGCRHRHSDLRGVLDAHGPQAGKVVRVALRTFKALCHVVRACGKDTSPGTRIEHLDRNPDDGNWSVVDRWDRSELKERDTTPGCGNIT